MEIWLLIRVNPDDLDERHEPVASDILPIVRKLQEADILDIVDDNGITVTLDIS